MGHRLVNALLLFPGWFFGFVLLVTTNDLAWRRRIRFVQIVRRSAFASTAILFVALVLVPPGPGGGR